MLSFSASLISVCPLLSSFSPDCMILRESASITLKLIGNIFWDAMAFESGCGLIFMSRLPMVFDYVAWQFAFFLQICQIVYL